MKIILFAKKNKPFVKEVKSLLNKMSNTLVVFEGERGDLFPKKARRMHADILISYLSPWIIPVSILKKTQKWNINFHPGSPEYPGIGCFNFALYDQAKDYGVTAHIMTRRVDRGKIIGVRKFKIVKDETVHSLCMKSYKHMFELFKKVMNEIHRKGTLPQCAALWKRIPYTRKELENLCYVTPRMTKGEIARRIRAVSYPNMPGARVRICGYEFEYRDVRK